MLSVCALASGKNLPASTFAFCSCVKASCGLSGSDFRAGIAGGSGLLWLLSLAQRSIFHSRLGTCEASARLLRQHFAFALCTTLSSFASDSLSSCYACGERLVRHLLCAFLASLLADLTSSFHHIALLPLHGLRRGTVAFARLTSSSISFFVASLSSFVVLVAVGMVR